MFSRIDHRRRLRNTFWCRYACVYVFLSVPARVYVPISWERNGTFLVKVFIRFLVKVPNFSTASDTYVYLCIIYHNVSRAVYVYFCYRKASVARKKGHPRSYRFSRRTRAFHDDETLSPSQKSSNYNHEYAKLRTRKISSYSYLEVTLN